jgi:hypothetical protein
VRRTLYLLMVAVLCVAFFYLGSFRSKLSASLAEEGDYPWKLEQEPTKTKNAKERKTTEERLLAQAEKDAAAPLPNRLVLLRQLVCSPRVGPAGAPSAVHGSSSRLHRQGGTRVNNNLLDRF